MDVYGSFIGSLSIPSFPKNALLMEEERPWTIKGLLCSLPSSTLARTQIYICITTRKNAVCMVYWPDTGRQCVAESSC